MAARRQTLGSMGEATQMRVAELTDPDVALVALLYRLAAFLDKPATATAAAADQYRRTLLALVAESQVPERTLDDLDDEVV